MQTIPLVIELKKLEDDRGFFSRLFCSSEFQKLGLESKIVQVNDSYSKERGTLRGMHYQIAPKEETKIVRCIRGSIYDVIIDLRKSSETYMKSFGAPLTEENRHMMYVPKGFAHGFLTLEPDTEVIYLVSESYSKEHEKGIRWNDPAFDIKWPFTPTVISEKDKQHPDFIP